MLLTQIELIRRSSQGQAALQCRQQFRVDRLRRSRLQFRSLSRDGGIGSRLSARIGTCATKTLVEWSSGSFKFDANDWQVSLPGNPRLASKPNPIRRIQCWSLSILLSRAATLKSLQRSRFQNENLRNKTKVSSDSKRSPGVPKHLARMMSYFVNV